MHHEKVTFKKKCELLNVSRGSMYYKPIISDNNDEITIINELFDIYRQACSYGYRRMTVALRERGLVVNHKRVLSLQKKAGIQAIYPAKKTTIKNPLHKVYPYLLRDLVIDRPNQVWQVDITYIKIKDGFVYLIALIDIFSRKIMGWELSPSMDTQACLRALHNALLNGTPEIVNSDQGSQFTSTTWTLILEGKSIKVSMDGKGRWADNIYIERLWRTVKQECVFLYDLETVAQARAVIADFVTFYNSKRYHSALNYHTPDFVFEEQRIPSKQELFQYFADKNTQLKEAVVF